MASPLYSKIYLQEIDQFPTVNIREKSSLASSKDGGGIIILKHPEHCILFYLTRFSFWGN